MSQSLFSQYLGDSPQIRIIDFFLDNRSDHSKREIVEATGMSKTTFYKVWPILEKFEIFTPARKHGNTQLYSLNKKSMIVRQFMSLDSALSKKAMSKMTDRKPKVSDRQVSLR